jgi:hypothetical protein
MQRSSLISVECIDANNSYVLGASKVMLLENGKIYRPALEKEFNAISLHLDTPDGMLIEADSAGHSNCSFEAGSFVKMYRQQPADLSRLNFEQSLSAPSRAQLEFTWSSFVHQHARALLTMLCALVANPTKKND